MVAERTLVRAVCCLLVVCSQQLVGLVGAWSINIIQQQHDHGSMSRGCSSSDHVISTYSSSWYSPSFPLSPSSSSSSSCLLSRSSYNSGRSGCCFAVSSINNHDCASTTRQQQQQLQRHRTDRRQQLASLLMTSSSLSSSSQRRYHRLWNLFSTSDGSAALASSTTANSDYDNQANLRIKVIGVGGAGGNAVNGMVSTTRDLRGVEFLSINTDVQALSSSLASETLVLGEVVTGGLGAGGKASVGEAAARESLASIKKLLEGADMCFITAGMGGGTGTGAAPIVAEISKDMGILTVSVVTRPFKFEGRKRSQQAEQGLKKLREHSDTCLVVANDRLLEIVPSSMSMTDAFLVADDILRQGVIGTSEMVLRTGLINVDFADVCSIIRDSGKALIGIGTGVGKGRAADAAVGAICSPLLDFPINEAKGVIFNIVGGPSLSLQEVDQAAKIVQENVDPDANIIIGALVDERCGDQVSVTVLATGYRSDVAEDEEENGGGRRDYRGGGGGVNGSQTDKVKVELRQQSQSRHQNDKNDVSSDIYGGSKNRYGYKGANAFNSNSNGVTNSYNDVIKYSDDVASSMSTALLGGGSKRSFSVGRSGDGDGGGTAQERGVSSKGSSGASRGGAVKVANVNLLVTDESLARLNRQEGYRNQYQSGGGDGGGGSAQYQNGSGGSGVRRNMQRGEKEEAEGIAHEDPFIALGRNNDRRRWDRDPTDRGNGSGSGGGESVGSSSMLRRLATRLFSWNDNE